MPNRFSVIQVTILSPAVVLVAQSGVCACASYEVFMRHQRFAVLWIALSLFMLLDSIGGSAARAQGNAIWPTKEWQTSTPEEQGMDSTELARLVEFGTSRSFDSLLIARHGRIVLDVYYAPYSADIPHAINSATKAVVGTLMAIAAKDGLLDSFDHRMLDFFGDRSLAEVRKNAITVQNLLDMTSGIDWTEPLSGRPDSVIEMRRSPDWIKFILDRPMSNAPGDSFNYNSGNSQLLSAIITKLTGMDAREYAKAKLFAPLGIDTANWLRDPQLLAIGGFGLAMLPRDMAKIGYLYLRKGEWEGRKLLPPTWIDKVSHATVDMKRPSEPDLRYSNAFWALPNKNVYMAVGYHCQLIMVFPALDIVAVTTARDFCPFSKLTGLISGAVKSETLLPPDPTGADLLTTAIRNVSADKPTAAGSTGLR
jgi:CubicO group peptidase (beta-lactamase class C family)